MKSLRILRKHLNSIQDVHIEELNRLIPEYHQEIQKSHEKSLVRLMPYIQQEKKANFEAKLKIDDEDLLKKYNLTSDDLRLVHELKPTVKVESTNNPLDKREIRTQSIMNISSQIDQ